MISRSRDKNAKSVVNQTRRILFIRFFYILMELSEFFMYHLKLLQTRTLLSIWSLWNCPEIDKGKLGIALKLKMCFCFWRIVWFFLPYQYVHPHDSIYPSSHTLVALSWRHLQMWPSHMNRLKPKWLVQQQAYHRVIIIEIINLKFKTNICNANQNSSQKYIIVVTIWAWG